MKDSGFRAKQKLVNALAIVSSFIDEWKSPNPIQSGWRKHEKPNGGAPTFKRNRRYQMKHGFKAKYNS